jgi:hypothetical protein
MKLCWRFNSYNDVTCVKKKLGKKDNVLISEGVIMIRVMLRTLRYKFYLMCMDDDMTWFYPKLF